MAKEITEEQEEQGKVGERPDFLLLIDSIGLIAVDAKSYSESRGVFTLGIDQDLEKLLSYGQHFHQPVWFAYRGEEENTWYWISALTARDVGDRRKRKDDGKEFLAIKKGYFAEIKDRKRTLS